MSPNIQRQVVDPNYCIGCGICRAVCPDSITIEINKDGFYQACIKDDISIEKQAKLSAICPFSPQSQSESEIGKSLFGDRLVWDEKLGYVKSCFAIRVVDGAIRENATSAGFATWILCELLTKGLIDAVIHVGPDWEGKNAPHFAYTISTTPEDVKARSKTRYYPVELGNVLTAIQNDSRRFAVVGLPCFIKGVQLLRANQRVWGERIRYTVGLFCGHLKSRLFTENLISAVGTSKERVTELDYRRKNPINPANKYIFGIRHGSEWCERDMASIPAGDWGSGAFKYYACNFCDDVVSETADVSVGDVWLPKYRVDGGGTNNVVVRNETIAQLIQEGHRAQRLWLEELAIADVQASTRGGFEDRREGTAYRLYLEGAAGRNAPKKRVIAEPNPDSSRRETYALKVLIGMISAPFYRFCRSIGCLWFFRGIMYLLIGAYRRRWPRWLHRTRFVSRCVVFIRKSRVTTGI